MFRYDRQHSAEYDRRLPANKVSNWIAVHWEQKDYDITSQHPQTHVNQHVNGGCCQQQSCHKAAQASRGADNQEATQETDSDRLFQSLLRELRRQCSNSLCYACFGLDAIDICNSPKCPSRVNSGRFSFSRRMSAVPHKAACFWCGLGSPRRARNRREINQTGPRRELLLKCRGRSSLSLGNNDFGILARNRH